MPFLSAILFYLDENFRYVTLHDAGHKGFNTRNLPFVSVPRINVN
jgi:hypothetical protein